MEPFIRGCSQAAQVSLVNSCGHGEMLISGYVMVSNRKEASVCHARSMQMLTFQAIYLVLFVLGVCVCVINDQRSRDNPAGLGEKFFWPWR